MKRIRIVGLCLVAVFAISIAASSASAAPVFYTKAAIGEVGKTVPFTGTLGAAFLEAKGGTKITCTGGTATGEVTGPTTAKNNVTKFTGCETNGLKCENAGPGEIVTKKLQGTLGGITAALPGLRLFDEGEGKGGKLAEFSCAGGAVPVIVKGSVIGSLSGASGTEPANGKFATSNKLSLAEAKGIQKYTKFTEGEGGTEQLESSVSGNPYEPSGQSVIATLKSTPAGNLGITK